MATTRDDQYAPSPAMVNLLNAITLEVARNEMLVLRPMTRQAVVDALNPAARAVLKRLRKRADRLRRA